MKKHFILMALIFTAMVANLAAQTLSEIQKKAKEETNNRVEKAIEDVLSGEKIVLPSSAKGAEKAYETSVKKAVKVFEGKVIKAMDIRDKEVQKSQKLFLKKLEVGLKSETKKGNLEGALAIKAKIEKLRIDDKKSETRKKTIKKKKISKENVLVLGTWKYFVPDKNKTFFREFTAEGMCIVSDESGKIHWAKPYKVNISKGKVTVEITQNESVVGLCTLTKDKTLIIKNWVAKKVK